METLSVEDAPAAENPDNASSETSSTVCSCPNSSRKSSRKPSCGVPANCCRQLNSCPHQGCARIVGCGQIVLLSAGYPCCAPLAACCAAKATCCNNSCQKSEEITCKCCLAGKCGCCKKEKAASRKASKVSTKAGDSDDDDDDDEESDEKSGDGSDEADEK